MAMTIGELAERIGATVVGDATRVVRGCAPLDEAGPDEISFLANRRYADYLETTRAAGVIVAPSETTGGELVRLEAADPYFAFRNAMIALHGFRNHPDPIDAQRGSAFVHPDARIGSACRIHPFAVIERDAEVGPACVLYPGAYVGQGARLGEGCVLFPNAVVYDRCVLGNRVTLHANAVVGNDGFGYATHQGVHHKIPQAGIVVVEDDVEIGAGCAIERAAMGETRIGQGTKFADLISIGHGTRIGRHCLLVSLVGISGSVEVGDWVAFGGQAGVTGHLRIGSGVQIAGKAAVVADVPAGMKVGGIPAIELEQAKRNALAATGLYELAKKVKELERRLKAAEGSDRPS